jgi:NUDIX domain
MRRLFRRGELSIAGESGTAVSRRTRHPNSTAPTGNVAYVTDPHKWVIHGERLVDDTPHVRVSLADVELPNHVRFTQYVFRMRRCAMTVVLDDAGERVLMMRRHRFIVDRWVWELPGGYVDDGEDSVTAAAREVEEETGWRPRKTEFVMS